MRIVQLADLHFGAEDARAIEAATDSVSQLAPDVVVVSGDMTQRGKHREFEMARKWIDSLDRPCLIVPGNHDTPLFNLVSRASSPFQRHDHYFDSYASMLRVDDVRIDGLNTARGWQARSNWAEGSVRLRHLANILNRDVVSDTIRVLACHHPFRSPKDAPLRTRTRRGAAASEMLAESDVVVLLTGHAISAGTLSTRLRSAPPAFNSLDITPTSVSVTTHDFKGSAFEARSLGSWKVAHLKPK